MVSLLDRGQSDHIRCKAAFQAYQPFITTWPCITEAMYFLRALREWEGQKALWNLIERNAIQIHLSSLDEWKRIRQLMEQYQDTPMDLADASLVSLAELRNLPRILTLDSDFYVYRINGTGTFDVISLDSE